MKRVILLSLLLSGCGDVQPKGDRELDGCAANMQKIGAAVHGYAKAHGGHYPGKLSDLVPLYLQAIPTCPAAGYDTYSVSYRSHAYPDRFDFCCAGSWHSETMKRRHHQ